MKRYVSLLRGINVAGHRKMKMPELKALYEALGFEDVVTYLQSGNVVFAAKKSVGYLTKMIEQAIENELGYAVSVLVIDKSSFVELASLNPLSKQSGVDEAFFHLTFLFDCPKMGVPSLPMQGEEIAELFRGHYYLYCPDGYGRTKLNNSFFERKLKVVATTRNWKTVNALVDLLEA